MIYQEAGQYKTNYADDTAIFTIRQDRWAIWALAGMAFCVVPVLSILKVPPFQSDYLFSALILPFLILSIGAIGLNVLIGYSGQISLGSGAFMAIGAYGAYNFAMRIPDLPIVLSLLLGAATAAVAGVIFGIPSLRIKGLYLAIATLAAQFFFDWAFLRVPWFTLNSSSGSVSAPVVNVLGWTLDTPLDKYLFIFAILTVVAIGVKNLGRGILGRQWMAIRDMDIAAEIIGIRPYFAKLTAFAVSSFILGLAGALWGFFYLGAWEPSAFSFDRSLQLLFMVIIGGVGSILGSLLGTAFILIVPILLDRIPSALGIPLSISATSNMQLVIFGSLIVFFLIIEPHGMAKLWASAKEKLRLWPFPY